MSGTAGSLPRRERRAQTCWRVAALVPAAFAGLCLADVGLVRAGDDAGIHAFFRSEARGSASLPPVRSAAPIPLFRPRQLAEPVRPRTTFARLPRAPEKIRPARMEPAESPPPPRPAPQTSKGGDPIAAVMKDPTLRPGDIVVFPEGPRVYRGGSPPPHRVADFEDLRRSRAISAGIRTKILAMTGERGSRGSGVTLVASDQRSATSNGGAGERPSSVRVIHPHFR